MRKNLTESLNFTIHPRRRAARDIRALARRWNVTPDLAAEVIFAQGALELRRWLLQLEQPHGSVVDLKAARLRHEGARELREVTSR